MRFPAHRSSIIYTTFAIITILLSFLPNIAPPAYAQDDSYSQYAQPNLNPDVPRNQHTFVQSAMIEVTSALYCLVAGIDIINPAQGCLILDPQTHKLGFAPSQNGERQLGGVIGFIPGMMSMMYIPPASSIDYMRYLAGNFGIVEPAHAQINGFQALQPLQAIWTSMRNIAYLLFVFIFIIIGIAIMLRIKIDPRTVMTIQNQIPRLIISILLITFSYAIAGFMIDMMWLATYTGINLLTESKTCAGDNLQKRATEEILSIPIRYGNSILQQNCDTASSSSGSSSEWNTFTKATEIMAEKNFFAIPIRYFMSFFTTKPTESPKTDGGIKEITMSVSATFGTLVNDLLFEILVDKDTVCDQTEYFKNVVSAGFWGKYSFVDCVFVPILTQLAASLIILIILITLVVLFFRIWFELLKAYVLFLLYVISAPLWIIMGLLPGKPLGFGRWLARIFATLAVFPATALLITFASILFSSFNNSSSLTAFIPPLVGSPNMANFGALLAFGVLLATPGLLAILQKSLHAFSEQGLMAGRSIASNLAGGAAMPRAFGGGIWNSAMGSHTNPITSQATGGIGFNILAGIGKPNSIRNKIFSLWTGNAPTKKT